ncbi:hypothetical protein ACI78Q_10525 [Geodermatophilus sp. SYSU D00705]
MSHGPVPGGGAPATSSADPTAPLSDLWSLAVPSTPPRVSREESARGLALLDLSLRMNHVTRISERLTYRESGYLARDVSMDVDLRALTTDQVSALRLPVDHAQPPEESMRGHVWLPIARQPRQDIAPVVVRDGQGNVLPRLTALRSARNLSAGLIRLFRMLLDAHPDGQVRGTALHALRHSQNRARWLVEMAIAHAVDESGSAHARSLEEMSQRATREPLHRDPGSPPLLESDSYSIRLAAQNGLEALLGVDHPFFRLLDFAVREQFLVVQVPFTDAGFTVQYELPRLSPVHSSHRLARWLRGFRPDSGVLVGTFATEVPREVESYHLELEVDEEVHVSRFALCTDVDAPLVTSITQDCAALAHHFDALRVRPDPRDAGSIARKLLETELQSVASKLSELARRRLADRTAYLEYYRTSVRSFGYEPERIPDPGLSQEEALARLDVPALALTDLAAFAGHYHADAYRQLAFSALTAGTLRNVARVLPDLQLGDDVVADDDPREHGAHVHWRPRFVEWTRRSAEPVSARAVFVLTDETPSLVGSVLKFIGCLALLVGFVVTTATRSTDWLLDWRVGSDARIAFESSDAVVAALLVVPGLLATRLPLPRTNSVLHHLRAYQTRLAYLAIGVTAVLALTIAGTDDPSSLLWAFRAAAGGLLLLLALSAWEMLLRRRLRRQRVPLVPALPAWLRQEMSGNGRGEVGAVDVRFDGKGVI